MGDSGKFPPIEVQEASTDGLRIGRDIAQISHELGVKGSCPAETQESSSPPMQKRNKQKLFEESHKLKAEMEQHKRQFAARK